MFGSPWDLLRRRHVHCSGLAGSGVRCHQSNHVRPANLQRTQPDRRSQQAHGSRYKSQSRKCLSEGLEFRQKGLSRVECQSSQASGGDVGCPEARLLCCLPLHGHELLLLSQFCVDWDVSPLVRSYRFNQILLGPKFIPYNQASTHSPKASIVCKLLF